MSRYYDKFKHITNTVIEGMFLFSMLKVFLFL